MSVTRKRKPPPKQVAANRQNGRESYGRRTPHGKPHVALNALRYGLHAAPVVKAMLAKSATPRATTPSPVSGHGQGWPCDRQK